jgi:hypothetical protein
MRTKTLKKNKINLVTLGCSKNIYDSEVLMGQLKANKKDVVHEKDEGNIIVINTCGFIENAKQESIDTILDFVDRKEKGEVDKEGFNDLYASSGYRHSGSLETLEILQYSYLPIDEILFDKSFFEKGDYVFPEAYFLKETSAITAIDDYDDKKSSHPNLKKRREALSMLSKNLEQGEDFLVSREAFMHCRKTARYELSRLHLNRREYAKSIYNSYILLRKDTNNRYLRFSVAKALNAASIYKNNRRLYKVIDDHEEVEGYSQQVYHFLEEIEKEELSILALSYCYRLAKDYPDDKGIQQLYRDALHELINEHEIALSTFYGQRKSEVLDELNKPDTNLIREERRNSKVARIKNQKKKEQVEDKTGDESYYKYAFVDFMDDYTFVTDYEREQEKVENKGYYQRNYSYRGFSRSDRFQKNKALGIDKIVLLCPVYLKLDERDEDGIKFLMTDERLEQYRNQVTEIANHVDLDITMLDYSRIAPKDVEQFNDIALLKSWSSERFLHTNYDINVSDFDYLSDFEEQYGTKYLALTGNLTMRIKERNVAGRILGSLIIYPIIPITIANLLTPDFESFNYFYLFDVTTGEALLADYYYYGTDDSEDYIRSIIYNHLLQITDQPKN